MTYSTYTHVTLGLEAQTSAIYRTLLFSFTTGRHDHNWHNAFAHTTATLVQFVVQPMLLNVHCFWYPVQLHSNSNSWQLFCSCLSCSQIHDHNVAMNLKGHLNILFFICFVTDGNFSTFDAIVRNSKQKGSRTLVSWILTNSNLKGLYFISDSFLDPFAFSILFYFSSLNYNSSLFPIKKKNRWREKNEKRKATMNFKMYLKSQNFFGFLKSRQNCRSPQE